MCVCVSTKGAARRPPCRSSASGRMGRPCRMPPLWKCLCLLPCPPNHTLGGDFRDFRGFPEAFPGRWSLFFFSNHQPLALLEWPPGFSLLLLYLFVLAYVLFVLLSFREEHVGIWFHKAPRS